LVPFYLLEFLNKAEKNKNWRFEDFGNNQDSLWASYAICPNIGFA
jgi:hypothetical protein